MRRNITIIIIVALLTIGAVIIYFLLRPREQGRQTFLGNLPIIGGRSPLGAPPPPPPPSTIQPEEAEARLRQIIDKDVRAPTLSKDQRSIYYVDRATGHLMASDLEGKNETTLANLTVLETFEGFWSPLKTKITLFYHENGVVKKFIEETATTTPSRFLSPDVQSFAWSPDGKSMAYLLRQGAQTNLVIADQLNRSAQTIFSTPVPDFTIQWASPNILLLVSRPSGLAPSLLMRFDINRRQADPILLGRRGVVTQILPDGSGFIFSQSSERGEAVPLARYSFKDAQTTSLGAITIAEKCASALDSKNIYCGVPAGTIRTPSPDEWYRGAVSLSDSIATIDLSAGSARTILENVPDIDVISPFTDADERFLFFQDKKTGTLWRLAL